MVSNSYSRGCTGGHLYHNAEENPKRVMAQSYGQPRTVRITTLMRQRRLCLAGHVMRYDKVANKAFLWKPYDTRRRDRPTTTLRDTIGKYTKLSGTNLLTTTKNRNHWKEIIVSPRLEDDVFKSESVTVWDVFLAVRCSMILSRNYRNSIAMLTQLSRYCRNSKTIKDNVRIAPSIIYLVTHQLC